MKISKIILFFLLCNVSINAQVGGERVYEFLNIATSARQIALGGKVLTLIDDVNQPLWNPSVINANLDNQLAVNYTSYLAGISIGSVSYSKMISRHFGTMHAGITYLNYGTLIAADENGNETSFKSITIQGEEATGGESTIFYETGGKFSYQDAVK